MSESIIHAVRFSPIPQIGERLNIAVVGLSQDERRVGAIYHSVRRVELVFGAESVERVQDTFRGIRAWLAASRAELSNPGGTVPAIVTTVRDKGLSIGLSEPIMVFDGTLTEALRMVADRYLVGPRWGTDDRWGKDLEDHCLAVLKNVFSRQDINPEAVDDLLRLARERLESLFAERSGQTVDLFAKGVGRKVAHIYKASGGDTHFAWEALALRGPIVAPQDESLPQRL